MEVAATPLVRHAPDDRAVAPCKLGVGDEKGLDGEVLGRQFRQGEGESDDLGILGGEGDGVPGGEAVHRLAEHRHTVKVNLLIGLGFAGILCESDKAPAVQLPFKILGYGDGDGEAGLLGLRLGGLRGLGGGLCGLGLGAGCHTQAQRKGQPQSTQGLDHGFPKSVMMHNNAPLKMAAMLARNLCKSLFLGDRRYFFRFITCHSFLMR